MCVRGVAIPWNVHEPVAAGDRRAAPSTGPSGQRPAGNKVQSPAETRAVPRHAQDNKDHLQKRPAAVFQYDRDDRIAIRDPRHDCRRKLPPRAPCSRSWHCGWAGVRRQRRTTCPGTQRRRDSARWYTGYGHAVAHDGRQRRAAVDKVYIFARFTTHTHARTHVRPPLRATMAAWNADGRAATLGPCMHRSKEVQRGYTCAGA